MCSCLTTPIALILYRPLSLRLPFYLCLSLFLAVSLCLSLSLPASFSHCLTLSPRLFLCLPPSVLVLSLSVSVRVPLSICLSVSLSSSVNSSLFPSIPRSPSVDLNGGEALRVFKKQQPVKFRMQCGLKLGSCMSKRVKNQHISLTTCTLQILFE